MTTPIPAAEGYASDFTPFEPKASEEIATIPRPEPLIEPSLRERRVARQMTQEDQVVKQILCKKLSVEIPAYRYTMSNQSNYNDDSSTDCRGIPWL